MATANGGNTALKEKMNEKALTPAQQKARTFQQIITSELAKNFKAMQSLVPKHVTPERLARVGLQAISRNPKLMECTPESVIGAIMNCATLGLEPNLIGHAFIIPFWNSKAGHMEAQFQIGYKGYLDLVRRTHEVSRIYAYEVHEHDEFDYQLGVDAKLTHKPKLDGDRGKVIAYYAVYHLKDGGFGFYVLSREEAQAHAERYSKSKTKDGKLFGPWVDNFDEMAKKTAIRLMVKYMPISIENQEAQNIMEGIARDEAVVKVKQDPVISEDAFFDVSFSTVDTETGEILHDEPAPNDSQASKGETSTSKKDGSLPL